ncbi:MAG: HAD family hydrolase [Candidatus Thermoplasmatota archaeon]|nr:HAD family hydrolase [Candidatus Thermoplasmatota archaeon]
MEMKTVKALGMDLDGTLVRMKLDLRSIRKELGIPEGDTLAYIRSLPKEKGDEVLSLIADREREAAEKAELMPGAKDLLKFCKERGVKVVIITRNSANAAHRTLEVLGLGVDLVIAREHANPKPSPEPINLALNHFGLKPYEMAYVGDYLYDIQAGKAAGIKTVLVTGHESAAEWENLADFTVDDLYEVMELMK